MDQTCKPRIGNSKVIICRKINRQSAHTKQLIRCCLSNLGIRNPFNYLALNHFTNLKPVCDQNGFSFPAKRDHRKISAKFKSPSKLSLLNIIFQLASRHELLIVLNQMYVKPVVCVVHYLILDNLQNLHYLHYKGLTRYPNYPHLLNEY